MTWMRFRKSWLLVLEVLEMVTSGLVELELEMLEMLEMGEGR